MNVYRVIVRLLAILGTGLLLSCIDGHEEYWVNPDGSGRAEIRYSLPASAARFQGGAKGVEKLLGNFLSSTPAITTSSHEVTESGGRLTARVTATFDSVFELEEISDQESNPDLPTSARSLTGDIKLDLVGRHLQASRAIAAGNAIPGSFFLPASQFAGHRLCYILHLPMAATTSNATRIENEGRTLTWDYPLAEAMRAPISLHFEALVPIPTLWVVAAIALVLALAVAAFVLLRSRKRKLRLQVE